MSTSGQARHSRPVNMLQAMGRLSTAFRRRSTDCMSVVNVESLYNNHTHCTTPSVARPSLRGTFDEAATMQATTQERILGRHTAILNSMSF